ncbi:MAG: hypothetical protein ABIW84_00010 [Ilumatobacteraceae bacterium]
MAESTRSTPVMTMSPVLHRLHHDWQRITIRSSELEAVRRWGLPGAEVRNLDDVLDRCGYQHAAPATHARSSQPDHDHTDVTDFGDGYLLRLVELARQEPLAGRIVLQRIIPPLCAVARRHSGNPQQRADLLDDLLANAWPVICRYPITRRRHRVASNLVRDITFQTVVRPARRRSCSEVPTDLELLVDGHAVGRAEPLEELVELLRDARQVAGISQADIDFICQLINCGRPEELAVILHVTPRTVRNHRDTVLHRLRTMVACAA